MYAYQGLSSSSQWGELAVNAVSLDYSEAVSRHVISLPRLFWCSKIT